MEHYSHKTQMLEDPLFKRVYEEAIAPSRRSGLDNYPQQLVATMVAYTVIVAVTRAPRILVDRDLDLNVPKQWRAEAMRIAVKLNILEATTWKQRPAWKLPLDRKD